MDVVLKFFDNDVFYLGVMKRSLPRIHLVRPEYRKKECWRLLHDNAPAHRSTLITDFSTKKWHFYYQPFPVLKHIDALFSSTFHQTLYYFLCNVHYHSRWVN